MKNKIYLVGSMGSGKSTIGRLLAKQICLPFFDLDKLIVDQERMSITDIFSKHNEEYFRELETNMLKKHSQKGNFVISTGGGCILRQQNIEILKQGLVVYLKISIHAQYERVKKKQSQIRPYAVADERDGRIMRIQVQVHLQNNRGNWPNYRGRPIY